MEILNNVKSSKRSVPILSGASSSQLEQVFRLLRTRGADERLISILHEFFYKTHQDADDIRYCTALLQAIINVAKNHRGTRLKIKLLQNFVLYGFNEPQLVMYYLDLFTEIRDGYTWEQAENLVRRLLIKISSPPFYHYHPELPSLQTILKDHLEEWMVMIEKDKYGFYTLKNGSQTPLFKLNVPVPVLMHIVRVMINTKLITLLVPTSQFFRFLSRIARSVKDEKLKPRTFQNGYVFDQPANMKKAIHWLKKMRREAKDMREQSLFSPDP